MPRPYLPEHLKFRLFAQMTGLATRLDAQSISCPSRITLKHFQALQITQAVHCAASVTVLV